MRPKSSRNSNKKQNVNKEIRSQQQNPIECINLIKES